MDPSVERDTDGIPEGVPRVALVMLTVGAILLALLVGESALRWPGRAPWREAKLFPNEPVMVQSDPVLGWRSKPGRYVFPGYSPQVERITFTIEPDGSRASAPSPVERSDRVVLVGDSITQGWAISDDQTFAWKLQARFPSIQILNYGTGGYGTYQSLLLLREVLNRISPPRLVIYPFIDDHEKRNVASFEWLQLLRATSRRGHASVPYCLLGPGGTLEEHPPQPTIAWPLRRYLATVFTLETAYLRVRTGGHIQQAQSVTQLLLRDMHQLARDHGSEFLVVFFGDAEANSRYTEYLQAQGIRFINCSRPWLRKIMVVGEGHPGPAQHSAWADCIASSLPELIGQAQNGRGSVGPEDVPATSNGLSYDEGARIGAQPIG